MAPDILREIMERRRLDAAADRRRVSGDALRAQAADRVHHSLAARLRGDGVHVIAEMKRASPSAGRLRDAYRPGELAAGYAAAGAAALSVLTEPHRFLGDGAHLREARAATDLPILRKDFTCDAYQVAEAAAWGADVVLLIVAALDAVELRALYAAARALGLEVLAEAHDAAELERALALEDAVVGVNSRDLRTLRTDLDTARRLARLIPAGRLSVAESGIRTRAEIDELRGLGYAGFLVGEALMRRDDPAAALRELAGPAAP